MTLSKEKYDLLLLDPESSSLPEIQDLKRIVENAKKLFECDLNKVFKWVSKPNHLFFGFSPYQMAMGGRGSVVYRWQEELTEDASPLN
jgi:hypothetical protein